MPPPIRRPPDAPPAANASPNARRLFGLQLQPLTPDLARALGVRAGSGVLVGDVDANSPAAQAGVRAGVVIYKIGSYAAESVAAVEALLRDVDGGTGSGFHRGPGARGRSAR